MKCSKSAISSAQYEYAMGKLDAAQSWQKLGWSEETVDKMLKESESGRYNTAVRDTYYGHCLQENGLAS